VFQIIRDTSASHPDVCRRALVALLDLLQGLPMESLRSEPSDWAGEARCDGFAPDAAPLFLSANSRTQLPRSSFLLRVSCDETDGGRCAELLSTRFVYHLSLVLKTRKGCSSIYVLLSVHFH